MICQPFEPFTAGYTGFTRGTVTSLFQAAEPEDDERPLVAAVAVKVIEPFPSGKERLQEFPAGQVKADPLIVPEIVRL